MLRKSLKQTQTTKSKAYKKVLKYIIHTFISHNPFKINNNNKKKLTFIQHKFFQSSCTGIVAGIPEAPSMKVTSYIALVLSIP